MSADRKPVDLVDGKVRRNPGEPSPEKAKSDDYKKPRVTWRDLTIAIENPAGSVRRGKGWEVRMKFDYGEIVGSMGVDGDPVDIYLGPNLDDAPMVYVVHQRKNKDWEKYDEDKVMAGFLTEEDARQAFLSNYTDPRFLGPITAMPIDEFITKVRGTKEKPTMIKAILFFKAHVGPYLRRGKLVNLAGYQGKQARAVAGAGQMDMFGDHPTDSAHASGGNWQMPIKDAIKEHKELIHAAETPGKADDKREVEKQREELGRMEASNKADTEQDQFAAGWADMPVKMREHAIMGASREMTDLRGRITSAAKKLASRDWNALPDHIASNLKLDVRLHLRAKAKRESPKAVFVPPAAVTEQQQKQEEIGHKDEHEIGGIKFTAQRVAKPTPHWRAVIHETGQVLDYRTTSTRGELWDKLAQDFKAVGADRWRSSFGMGEKPANDSGAFDSENWHRKRDDRIKASREAGNVHLDKIPAYVETMRGKEVYSVHDPKERGVIRTVDNNGNVYVNWSDKYSAEKNLASPSFEGKKQVFQTSLGPTDLKDYVLARKKEGAELTGSKQAAATIADEQKAKPILNRLGRPFATKEDASDFAVKNGLGETHVTVPVTMIVNNKYVSGYQLKQKPRTPAATYNAAVTSTKTGTDNDNPRRKYYVTIARHGKGVSKLVGPFDTHDEAKAHVERAIEEAVKIDPRAHFDAFGTAGVEADEHKPGVLNERLGIKRR